ncbi:MAG TPA: SAM-dependent chlorinase/fluorinase [Candidatus Wunengus californicus]
MTARQPRVITLLTDFGNQDAYVGIMKLSLIHISEPTRLLSIS